MENSKKLVISIISAVVALTSLVVAIIIFRNELSELLAQLCDKVREKKTKVLGGEEFSDYADV